jgi:arabinose-5-phosphate isomerase
MIQKTKDLTNVKASDIMGKNPVSLTTGILASKAIKIIKQKNITQIIVKDQEGAYFGMIHLHDLINEGISEH